MGLLLRSPRLGARASACAAGRPPAPCSLAAAPQPRHGQSHHAALQTPSSVAGAAACRGAAGASQRGSVLCRVAGQEESQAAAGREEPPSQEPGIAGALLVVAAAVAFGIGVYAVKGPDSASEFFAGYLLEQSLSVDNLFVFVLLFSYFRVPKEYEPKVLEYGILGAAGLRAIFIGLGAVALERFRPVLLVFAALLLVSSAKLLFGAEEEEEEGLESNGVVALVRRLLPVSAEYDGDSFFTGPSGARQPTPLLLVLVCVELSDLLFAVDSIPAVFGVTQDPLIIWTSNMFAIAALRSFFPLVQGALGELRFLDKAVSLVLGFIGFKMIADFAGYHISTGASLAVVVTTLAGGVGASLLLPEPKKE